MAVKFRNYDIAALTVMRPLPTTDPTAQSPATSCETRGGRNGFAVGFISEFHRFSPDNHHSTSTLTLIYHCPVRRAVSAEQAAHYHSLFFYYYYLGASFQTRHLVRYIVRKLIHKLRVILWFLTKFKTHIQTHEQTADKVSINPIRVG